jgi:hypothetical protein
MTNPPAYEFLPASALLALAKSGANDQCSRHCSAVRPYRPGSRSPPKCVADDFACRLNSNGAPHTPSGLASRSSPAYILGTNMMCAFGVPGYITHGVPSAGTAESPSDSGVAFGI